MPLGVGSTSYFLLGYQSEPGVFAPFADYKNTIYQFNGGGIGLNGEFTNTPANKGNLAPTPSILGQVDSQGSVRIAHDAKRMGFWLQQIMLDDAVVSVQIATATYVFLAAAALTNDTGLVGPSETGPAALTKVQPKFHLPSLL